MKFGHGNILIDGIPNLRGLNKTEFWALTAMMDGDECEFENGPMFAEMGEFTVTTPGGDRYKFTEFYETVTCIEKLKEKK